MDNKRVARELLKIAKILTSEIIKVDFAVSHLRKVMKALKVGDRVEVGYYNSQRGGDTTSTYKVNLDWKGWKETGMTKLSVGIIGRGTPHGQLKGQGGIITDYGKNIMFQPTMNANMRDVTSLKKL